MRHEKRMKYTKNYVECILNNHNSLEPLKSCELSKDSRQDSSCFGKVRITNAISNMQLKLVQPLQGSQVLHPTWREEAQLSKHKPKNNEDLQMDFFIKKNEQIANGLMKDRKSMSDIVYMADPNEGHRNLYSKFILESKMTVPEASERYKLNLMFPNIHKPPKKAPKEKHFIMVTNGKEKQKQKEGENQVNKDAQQERPPTESDNFPEEIQPSYSEVTNVQIQQFLKLKQQSYKSDVPFIREEPDITKKKKNKNRQKLLKKQKDKIKNSLQEFLQAKVIHRMSSKLPKQIGERNQQNRSCSTIKIEPPATISDPIALTEQTKLLKKINERSHAANSYNKQKKATVQKIKISHKNLFSAETEVTIYQGKVKMYREFLFILNLAHGVFDPISIPEQIVKNQVKYKYYVGLGNNRQLIKALMKRRFWWVETNNAQEANFVWTQLRLNSYYEQQRQVPPITQFEQPEQNSQSKPGAALTKKSYLYRAPMPSESVRKVLSGPSLTAYRKFSSFIETSANNSDKFNNFDKRLKFFPNLKQNSEPASTNRIHNHLEQNFLIGNKKALFYNLKAYYDLLGKNVYDIIPLTFHIGEQGSSDPVFKQFLRCFKQNQLKKNSKNIWIVKPGENSNRGNGITVVKDMSEINKILKSSKKSKNDGPSTHILQKYIEKPMLYKGRKFDIRHYMLATKLHGKMRLYWHAEGYVRTSSFDYDLQEIEDVQVHLTNDAIQKHCENYGKYEEGNKISYTELQRYFDCTYPNRKYSLVDEFYPRIKAIGLDAFKASYLHMDPRSLEHNFQVFGLDFMIDSNFDVWLIEVNTNPCLELSSGLLNRIIPNMIEHSLRLTIDPLFPVNSHYANSLKHTVPDNPLERLQFQLIFDEARDGKQPYQLLRGKQMDSNLQNLQEDQETYENDGNELDIDLE